MSNGENYPSHLDPLALGLLGGAPIADALANLHADERLANEEANRLTLIQRFQTQEWQKHLKETFGPRRTIAEATLQRISTEQPHHLGLGRSVMDSLGISPETLPKRRYFGEYETDMEAYRNYDNATETMRLPRMHTQDWERERRAKVWAFWSFKKHEMSLPGRAFEITTHVGASSNFPSTDARHEDLTAAFNEIQSKQYGPKKSLFGVNPQRSDWRSITKLYPKDELMFAASQYILQNLGYLAAVTEVKEVGVEPAQVVHASFIDAAWHTGNNQPSFLNPAHAADVLETMRSLPQFKAQVLSADTFKNFITWRIERQRFIHGDKHPDQDAIKGLTATPAHDNYAELDKINQFLYSSPVVVLADTKNGLS